MLAASDDRIVALHQENQGQIMARQAALRHVQTVVSPEATDDNYILFLDSDDTLKENALGCIADHIRETQCDMLIYGMDWVRDGKVIGEFRGKTPPFEGTVTDKATLYQIVLGDMFYNSLCRKVIPLRLVTGKDSSQYRHIRHGEDLLQSLEYLKDSGKTVFIRDRLYNYRINPASVTHTDDAENYRIDTTVRTAVLRFLAKENVWDQEQYNRYYRFCGSVLFETVLKITNFPLSSNKKRTLLQQINNDAYYKQVLSRGGNKNPVLYGLKKKRYGSVILMGRMYESARRLRNRLR